MLIWKSSSPRVFQDPDRKSRHQANALLLVSKSTSSDLPPLKDSASESSSQIAPGIEPIALNLSSSTSLFPTLLFSIGGPIPSPEVRAVPKSSTLSVSPSLYLLLVTFRRECIVRLCPKEGGLRERLRNAGGRFVTNSTAQKSLLTGSAFHNCVI